MLRSHQGQSQLKVKGTESGKVKFKDRVRVRFRVQFRVRIEMVRLSTSFRVMISSGVSVRGSVKVSE